MNASYQYQYPLQNRITRTTVWSKDPLSKTCGTWWFHATAWTWNQIMGRWVHFDLIIWYGEQGATNTYNKCSQNGKEHKCWVNAFWTFVYKHEIRRSRRTKKIHTFIMHSTLYKGDKHIGRLRCNTCLVCMVRHGNITFSSRHIPNLD